MTSSEFTEDEQIRIAFSILKEHDEIINRTICRTVSTVVPVYEKELVLSKLKESCPNLYVYADNMRVACREEQVSKNGIFSSYINTSHVSKLRNKYMYPEEDNCLLVDSNWFFNSIILFIMEKIGYIE